MTVTNAAAGPAVRDVRPGDHVVLPWSAPCHRCEACAAVHTAGARP